MNRSKIPLTPFSYGELYFCILEIQAYIFTCLLSKVLAVTWYFLPLFAGVVSLQSSESKSCLEREWMSWISMKDLEENLRSDYRRQHGFFFFFKNVQVFAGWALCLMTD